ncbi:MAG: tRNA (adenosine(37)-N6)-threonylcarbamoyltransferase complex transferase subunit TsaD [Eubacteriales bacterium]|jgi:N6-L-threonylcarbamoyladenine synthase|nr:tRNA (adenosine(37)-N6)-threonylcarbamoyltransferase complex transferase subunit TsaD [Eubacteriales bacterium]
MTHYERAVQRKLDELKRKPHVRILAIETSCDETAAAVVADGRTVLSNAVHTQIPLHAPFGGVVPEIASRSHVQKIGAVVRLALGEAGLTLNELDAVAVTSGPGLVGALLVGLSYAKGLAYAAGLPFLGVHHIAAHIAANYLSYPALTPPFTCLVASGGHSHIIVVEDYDRYRLIGRTRDDAAGEAFDKVARVLGLPYPGGPNLEQLAMQGDPTRYRFRSAFNEGEGLDFSFSGIKTAVVNRLHNAEQAGEAVNRADLAASFQKTVVDILAEKSVRAAKAQSGEAGTKLALAGGVSANRALREAMEARAKRAGIAFYCPAFEYCTDNAAMVASAAYGRLLQGRTDALSLNAAPYLSIEER